jgi:GAF domain-containing protein
VADELSVELEKERQRNAEHHAMIEEQNNNLANLYVASYGLHGTLATEDVLCTIKEIVTNLVGSEELAIFERCEETDELKLLDSVGIDKEALGTLSIEGGFIGHAIKTGQPCVADHEPQVEGLPHEQKLTACIPLMVSDVARGAIAIFGLLQQKTELADLDFELFDLLGSQAANALYTAQLHERFGKN